MSSNDKLQVQIGADKTDFDKKIKEVEFDIKELSKVKLEKLKLGLDTTEINAQIKDAKANLSTLKTTVKDTGQVFEKSLTPKVANAGNTLTQFSRIAQDAPFGIIGIGNNITATAESFSYLKQQTGSTGGALKALGSSILGTGGILLGVSLLTTGLTYLAQSGLSVGDVIDKISGDFDAFGRNLQKVNEEAAKTAGTEVANLKALISVAQDETKSRHDRLIAVQELQKEFPGYFGNLNQEKILNGDLTSVTKELTSAIVARAKASAYASEIGRLASEELQLNNKINNELDSMIKNYGLTSEEAKKFRKEVEAGADAFKLLDPFKKRAGIFDVSSAVLSSNAIKDIRVQLIENAKQQGLYTDKINETTAASIKLREEATKPVKTFDTPQVKPIDNQLTPAGLAVPKIIGLDKFKETFIGMVNTVKVATAEMILLLQEFDAAANDIILNSITSTFSNLGSAIGTALATGGDVLSAIGQTLIQALGQFLSSMGDLLIKYGTLAILKGKLDLAIAAGGPVSIAAGIAAVAVGVALKAAGSAIGSFAGSGGKSNSSSGAGANNSSFSSSSFSGGNGGGTVVFEIAGQKLIGVLSNTINANRRLGGQLGIG
jgi:hypothetical protein